MMAPSNVLHKGSMSCWLSKKYWPELIPSVVPGQGQAGGPAAAADRRRPAADLQRGGHFEQSLDLGLLLILPIME